MQGDTGPRGNLAEVQTLGSPLAAHDEGNAGNLAIGGAEQVIVGCGALQQKGDVIAAKLRVSWKFVGSENRGRADGIAGTESVLHLAANRQGFEGREAGAVVFPKRRMEPRLHADLLQEAPRVPVMVRRHAGQKQSTRLAAGDDQAVLAANNHRAGALFAARRHGRGIVEDPDFYLQVLELGR